MCNMHSAGVSIRSRVRAHYYIHIAHWTARTMNPTLQANEEAILTLFSEGRSYADISEYLRQLTGETQGLSARYRRGVRVRPLLDQPSLDRLISSLVSRVGHSYGRRTMHGLLSSVGVQVCQARVAISLSRIAPIQYACRRNFMNRLLNPFPYHARFCYIWIRTRMYEEL